MKVNVHIKQLGKCQKVFIPNFFPFLYYYNIKAIDVTNKLEEGSILSKIKLIDLQN